MKKHCINLNIVILILLSTLIGCASHNEIDGKQDDRQINEFFKVIYFDNNNSLITDALEVFKDSLYNNLGCNNFEYYKLYFNNSRDTNVLTISTSPNLLVTLSILFPKEEEINLLYATHILNSTIITDKHSYKSGVFNEKHTRLDSLQYRPELNFKCFSIDSTKKLLFFPKISFKFLKSNIVDIEFELYR